MNLKDFLQLAGQQGKVVVVDDSGDVKGVFLPFEEFQKLSGTHTESLERIAKEEDIAEKANREILQAQLEEVISSTNGGLAAADVEVEMEVELPERIDSVLSKRAQELFKSIPYESPHHNFRTPEVASTGDEEISTNFDDI